MSSVPTHRAGSPSPPGCGSTPDCRKDLVITGIGLRMEIWDAAEWEAYEARQEAAYAAPERGLLES